ncbi:MAG TPA: hypothetical protein VHB97_01345 [Polyangia bacterium]|nr:hypothetical protein [Polyangia bacterium]
MAATLSVALVDEMLRRHRRNGGAAARRRPAARAAGVRTPALVA